MTANMSALDRGYRFSLGAMLLGSAAFLPVVFHWAFAVAGLVGVGLIAVALKGWCPVFALFGWSENTTCTE